jgi:hypothetical protein
VICCDPSCDTAGLVCGMVEMHAGSLTAGRALLEESLSLEDVPLPPTPRDAVRRRTRVPGRRAGSSRLSRPGPGPYPAGRGPGRTERPSDRSFATQVACFVNLILCDLDALASAAADAMGSDVPTIAALGRFSSGRVRSANGDGARAAEMMREAIEAYRTTGQRIGLPFMLSTLGEAHLAAGATAAALACVAEARTVVETSGEIRDLAELHRLEGTLHAAGGDRLAAEQCLERAIAVAREQGTRWQELRATTTLARLTFEYDTGAGVRRTAGEDVARLVESFTEGADLPDVRAARQIVADQGGDKSAAEKRHLPHDRKRAGDRVEPATSSLGS